MDVIYMLLCCWVVLVVISRNLDTAENYIRRRTFENKRIEYRQNQTSYEQSKEDEITQRLRNGLTNSPVVFNIGELVLVSFGPNERHLSFEFVSCIISKFLTSRLMLLNSFNTWQDINMEIFSWLIQAVGLQNITRAMVESRDTSTWRRKGQEWKDKLLPGSPIRLGSCQSM
jgi:hypothetical protein